MNNLHEKLRLLDEAVLTAVKDCDLNARVIYGTRERFDNYLLELVAANNSAASLPAVFVCHKTFTVGGSWMHCDLDVSYNVYAAAMWQEDINRISGGLMEKYRLRRSIPAEGWDTNMQVTKFRRSKSSPPMIRYKYRLEVGATLYNSSAYTQEKKC